MGNRRWLAAVLLGALLIAFWSGTKYEAWREADQAVELVGNRQLPAEDGLDEIEEEPSIFIHVTGAVEHSGVYELKQGQRVEDALTLAGLQSNAAVDALNRAALLTDGQKIVVPTQDELSGVPLGAAEIVVSTPTDGRISINQADKAALMQLPGIGEVKAQAIIDYRLAHGGFQTLDELKNVKGIGDKTYQGLEADIVL